MKIQNQPIFISGPHGGGKSTLLNKLSSSSNMFVENNFDIDFTIDFPSMSALSHFERSLIRLYHRFFIFHYAYSLAETHSDRFILTNRTVYDSEAYINVYRKLKWISEDEFFKLDFIIRNFNDQPCTIVLNPPVSVLKSRLIQRRNKATRINRDKIFEKKNTELRTTSMCVKCNMVKTK